MPLNIAVRTSTAAPTDQRPTQPETDFRPSALNVSARLYDYLKRRRREFRPERVYASQIKECGRKLAMAIMGFEKGPTGEGHPEWIVSADLGSWLHDRVEGWLREIGGLVKAEFNVKSEDGTLSGRVDALLADTVRLVPASPVLRSEPEAHKEVAADEKIKAERGDSYEALIEVEGEQYILDAKTISEKDYKAGLKSFKIPGYVAQISVYGRLLGVKKGIILLVNRNTGEFADLEFDIDFDYADRLLERAGKVMQSVETRTLPAAEEWGDTALGSYYCRNLCPFYRQCAEQQRDGSIQNALDAGAAPEAL